MWERWWNSVDGLGIIAGGEFFSVAAKMLTGPGAYGGVVATPCTKSSDRGRASHPGIGAAGGGELLAAILSHNLEGGGVLFELPAVIDVARQTLQLRRLGGRVELIAGDFRHEVPAGGDLYLLKILLNWDDEHALRILRNCHRAATPESKLLVIEWLLPGDPEPSGVHLVNLNMLVMLGGKQRSAAEYRQLLEATGYASNRHSNERLELPVEHHRGHPHLATSPP